MEFQIVVPGLAQAVQRLGRVTTEQVLRAPLMRAQAQLVNILARYPSPPPASTYRRTGDLGRAWAAPPPSGLNASVQNKVRSRQSGQPYAGWVQSASQQASVHQGRWTTDADAVRQAMPTIERDFGQAVQDAL